jgi:hypothetical protein
VDDVCDVIQVKVEQKKILFLRLFVMVILDEINENSFLNALKNAEEHELFI